MPEVIDAWFDSGSMPFAQWGAPLRNLAAFESAYPAQFICEAIDQTRGWFYSLMAVGTLVFGRSAYENVVCLGLVTDEAGQEDVQAPRQRHRADGADGLPWRRRGALVLRRLRVAVGAAAGRVRRARRDRAEGAAYLLEHRVVPGALRECRGCGRQCRRRRRGRGRVDAGGGGARAGPRLAAAARPVAAVRGARVHQGRDVLPRGVRLGRRRTAARRAHRRPVQLVRAAVAPPVLGRALGIPRRGGGVRDAA